ncbi:MAG: hypothetical protein B7Z58_08200 [Acidiphilium sp. 37-64-53]|nr:MAG: hypothetical protein B7Z58_08200 [Acidiphilium sp. 37-64-53]OZB23914.1 MAG: hypothetical protein B7X49_15450 [Acidiphilium sp. 34-64-41]
MTGATAMAQSSAYQSSTTTTQVAPVQAAPAPIVPPAPGVLSRTTVSKTNDGMGDQTYSRKTTYGNGDAAASQSMQTHVVQPPVAIESSKRTTTTTTTTPSN